jgi:hypothetical protein
VSFYRSLKRLKIGPHPKYEVVITRQKAVLFDFLKVRAIVNGTTIYQLEKDKPLTIDLHQTASTLVITDGFHCTRTFALNGQADTNAFLTVVCILDNDRLLAGAILTLILFLAGLTSGILFIRALSFVPTLYFLYSFYFNRQDFIKVWSTRTKR